MRPYTGVRRQRLTIVEWARRRLTTGAMCEHVLSRKTALLRSIPNVPLPTLSRKFASFRLMRALFSCSDRVKLIPDKNPL